MKSKRKAVSGIMLTLLLIGMLTLAFNIQPVKASGTIYIRADGSVDPPTAPIASTDNVTYTFIDNINESIVVERSNIIIDGNGYKLEGSWVGYGFYLSGISNVTIQNTNIKRFETGVYFNSSSYNTISGNNITNNDEGVYLEDSSYNTISGNNITNNGDGVHLYWQSVDNAVSGNNITNNDGGVWLEDSSSNTISGNSITNNNFRGVLFSWSSFNTVSANNITDNDNGIWLSNSSFNTVFGNHITDNRDGVHLSLSSNHNTLSWNNITNNNRVCVRLFVSSFNTISGNTMKNNSYGVYLESSSNNRIYHNNIINNSRQVFFKDSSYPNVWDYGYAYGGNYWSNYTDVDLFSGAFQNVTGSDGIGDIPHIMDANNTDNYPLMGMFSSFNAFPGYYVNVISNSTIEDFEFEHSETNSTITMHVSNTSSTQSFGFCRLSIPKGLMAPPYKATIDDGSTEVLNFNDTIYDNSTHRWIYFAYEHSTREVEIQGFSPPIISILSPENKTYPANDVPLTFTVSESTSWIGYSLDGQTNVTISGNTTIVDLSEGVHTITVYASDTAGYRGSSNRVYFTVDIMPPNIEILSPENKTYVTSSVSLSFIVDEATSWIGYSLDGQMNVTIAGNTTISELSIGTHSLITHANDTVGNRGSSDIVYFTILDTTPPSISIVSPKNNTYTTTDIPLTFTVDESVIWMAYSLDGQSNITITGNATLYGLFDGSHSLIVYANDTAGNTGASEMVYFSIATQKAEPLQLWIVAVIVGITIVGAALLIYFAKVKKPTEKVE